MSAPPTRAAVLRRWLPVAAAWVLGALLPFGLLALNLHFGSPKKPATERYNELVQGFEAGHLFLHREVPAALASLPDPYDSEANESVRGGLDQLLDLSYFHGHLYLYFGVVPAVAVFLPWHWLTGHWLPEVWAVAAFIGVGFLAGAALLTAAWRRCFPGACPGQAAGCILLLATGTTAPLIAARPHVWEVPVAAAFAFGLLAVGAAWMACQSGSRRSGLGWLAATGLLAGLVVGCRANLLFGSVLLSGAAAWGAASARVGRGGPDRLGLGAFGAAFLPLALVGGALAYYNWARFGDVLQFGQHYQLASDNVHSRAVFSTDYLLDNLRVYFLSGPRWGRHFPFVWRPQVPTLSPTHGDVEDVFGALPSIPAVFLALGVPLVWRGRQGGQEAFVRGGACALAGLFVLAAGVMMLFYGSCNRYQVDFMPWLVLLATLAILGIDDRLVAAGALSGRRLWRGLCGVLVAYSASTMVLGAVARCEYTCLQDVVVDKLNSARREQMDSAIPVARRLVAIANGYDGYVDLGLTQLATNRPADAVGSLTEAIRLDPDNFKAEYDLGVALVQSGHLDRGFDTLLDALHRHPGKVVCEGDVGLNLESADRDRQAIPLLRDALRTFPNSWKFHASLGKALERTGATKEAIWSLREAIRLGPPDAEVLNNLGVVLFQTGAREEALERFQEALILKPDMASARRNLNTILSGP